MVCYVAEDHATSLFFAFLDVELTADVNIQSLGDRRCYMLIRYIFSRKMSVLRMPDIRHSRIRRAVPRRLTNRRYSLGYRVCAERLWWGFEGAYSDLQETVHHAGDHPADSPRYNPVADRGMTMTEEAAMTAKIDADRLALTFRGGCGPNVLLE